MDNSYSSLQAVRETRGKHITELSRIAFADSRPLGGGAYDVIVLCGGVFFVLNL